MKILFFVRKHTVLRRAFLYHWLVVKLRRTFRISPHAGQKVNFRMSDEEERKYYQTLVRCVPMLGTVTTNVWYEQYQSLVRWHDL
ncbi:MAG: hypothetical protein SPI30_02625 [Prevotella sp.]|nr:hypothetical protein [Prevotella sp.]